MFSLSFSTCFLPWSCDISSGFLILSGGVLWLQMYSTGMLIRFLGELGTVSPFMQLTSSLMIVSVWEEDRLKIFAPLNLLLNDLASINNWGFVVQLFAPLLNLALNAQLLGCLGLCVV